MPKTLFSFRSTIPIIASLKSLFITMIEQAQPQIFSSLKKLFPNMSFHQRIKLTP